MEIMKMAKGKKGIKSDMKLRRSVGRKVGKLSVTKKDFHAILDKASQPVKDETESEPKQS